MNDIPFDFLAYIDDLRSARRDSSPCSVCGYPDPARLNVDGCSECDGTAERLRTVVVEDHGTFVVTADMGD